MPKEEVGIGEDVDAGEVDVLPIYSIKSFLDDAVDLTAEVLLLLMRGGTVETTLGFTELLTAKVYLLIKQ